MLDGPRRQKRLALRRPRLTALTAASLVGIGSCLAQSPAIQSPAIQSAASQSAGAHLSEIKLHPSRRSQSSPPSESLPPSADTAFEQQIAPLLAASAVARAHWGLAVATLDGRPLVELDGAKLFHPASNAKLFTTAAAMALLGPDATVTTRIEARGPIQAGTLSGNLAIVGSGDADFATDDVPYHPPARHTAAVPPPPTSEPVAAPSPLHDLQVMADAVVAAGIRTIAGDIVGDDTAFAWEPYPEDWASDDRLWGYGAPVSALALHDNQIALHLRPGATPGAPALAAFEPDMPPWFTLDTSELRTAPANSGTHVEIGYVPEHPRVLRVWGTIARPAHNAPGAPDDVEQIAIPDPALFAAEALRGMLLARGVSITGTARAQHRLPDATESLREQAHQPLPPYSEPIGQIAPVNVKTLATTTSPTLLADETATNKLSQNLHAELLLERLGERFGAQPAAATQPDPAPAQLLPATQPLPTAQTIDPASRAQGVRVVRSILPLAGIDPDDVVLVDGSGLSTHDLVTPRALVHLLTWAAAQPWFAGWRSTLPVGGVDGTLANRFVKPPLTGRIVAKTGTLGEARALSGYLTCASGRIVAFSILVDNHTPGSIADRDTTDHILAALYAAL